MATLNTGLQSKFSSDFRKNKSIHTVFHSQSPGQHHPLPLHYLHTPQIPPSPSYSNMTLKVGFIYLSNSAQANNVPGVADPLSLDGHGQAAALGNRVRLLTGGQPLDFGLSSIAAITASTLQDAVEVVGLREGIATEGLDILREVGGGETPMQAQARAVDCLNLLKGRVNLLCGGDSPGPFHLLCVTHSGFLLKLLSAMSQPNSGIDVIPGMNLQPPQAPLNPTLT